MNVPALIEKMLVLFFAMAAGFVCGKRGWLDDTANRTISRLVVMLTNPMLALSSVMGKERLMSNWQVLALTGISFALILSCMLLSRGAVSVRHGRLFLCDGAGFVLAADHVELRHSSGLGAWKIPLAVEHSQKSLSDCLVNRVHHLSDRA